MSEPKQKKKVDYRSAWVEARALVADHRRALSIGLGLMVINRLAGLVLPYTPKYLIDDIITKQQGHLLLPLVGAIALATVIQAITSFSISQVVSVAAQGAIAKMRRDVQAHILRLPVSYFDANKTGVMISRIMTDPEGIRNLVGTGLIQLVGGMITALIALVVLLRTNWQLTLGTLALMMCFAGAMSIAFKRLRPIFRKRGEIQAEVTGRLTESLGGVRLLKTYVAEEREEKVFAGGVDRLFRNIASTISGTSAVGAVSTVIIGMVSVLIMYFGGHAILDKTMTLGELIRYIFFVGVMVAPLVQISSISTQISEAFAGLDRIHEIRSQATEDQQDQSRTPVVGLGGEVQFENVLFEYHEDVPVLKDIDFHAPAGTTTALVGPSGSGKSTLVGLIMAFYRPKSGRILIDGRDLNDLRLREYRQHLGVVMQDNFLFDGTVRENIAFAKPGATDEEIRAASHIAHCDEFIDRWDDGYNTIVGERGVKLSGGQRQRVAIARAILADPRVLILDEATSSLDSEAEAMIQDGLRHLRRGRTTFVIAHRLSTVRSADQILVLDTGRIVERGTHDSLMSLHGLYRRLYERQYGLITDLFINPGEEPSGEEGSEKPSLHLT
ncbi:MAG: ABC transporter ATP-binding protein [Longimicrobiales bacterium]